MYLVFIEDNEMRRKTLFVTELRLTADSFVKTFRDQIKALELEIPNGISYPDEDQDIDPWFETSGWNKRVYKLAQCFSNTYPITTEDFIDTFFKSYYSLSYEGVRLI